jgi:hypothetical protein
MFELIERAVKALEKLADNSQRIADTQDKSIVVAKKMTASVVKMLDSVPAEVKEQDEYVLIQTYVTELADAINEL